MVNNFISKTHAGRSGHGIYIILLSLKIAATYIIIYSMILNEFSKAALSNHTSAGLVNTYLERIHL